jgi:septal ring factor EnvC (AmiA/AmiB activator)
MRKRALQALQGRKGDYRVDFISVALTSKKVDFSKVLGMIDEMVALLQKEQGDDDDKKEYCEGALDKAEDKHKELEEKIKDYDALIADTKESIETLTSDIAALSQGIKDLDKAVAEATETRKEEHAENTETLANNNAAKELMGFAKNRLNKFYNPKLYKPPAKKELSKEDRIVENMSLMQGAPPPPPEAVGAYKKKGEEATGVIGMIDLLIADCDKEIQEVETEEKNAQEEYETFMEDSKDKRAADSKSIEEKEGAKAEGEASLEKATLERKDTLMEAMATAQVIGDLHTECDWLLMNYDARKSARDGEIGSLKDAKAVLSGADYSLVQTAFLRRRA